MQINGTQSHKKAPGFSIEKAFGGEYLDLVPFEKIRYSDRFDDPNLPSQMHTTISLRQVSCGTELIIAQEGVPEAIPVEMCHLGRQESLAQLAKLVTRDP